MAEEILRARAQAQAEFREMLKNVLQEVAIKETPRLKERARLGPYEKLSFNVPFMQSAVESAPITYNPTSNALYARVWPERGELRKMVEAAKPKGFTVGWIDGYTPVAVFTLEL